MDWVKKFMMGRYGGDQFSIFLIIISMVLTLLYYLTGSSLVFLLSYIPILAALYRMFSKDIQKRSLENYKFAAQIRTLNLKIKKIQERIKASKTHKYFKCANCKTSLRVPKGKGKILVTCPKCKTEVRKKT